MDSSAALSAFSALAQPMRLDIFRLLIRAGGDGMAAGQIAAALEVRQNTLSANLALLHGAGLLRRRRAGRSIRYYADIAGLRGLLTFLMQDCCQGQPAICQPLIDQIACDCAPPPTLPSKEAPPR